ncbi:MAG: hypothetical protein DHS20C10_07520 [marine bacterium B5-7]|nr:MAG: hypothetical protein DHS20C10_07520 [marine bacterium B5-7]
MIASHTDDVDGLDNDDAVNDDDGAIKEEVTHSKAADKVKARRTLEELLEKKRLARELREFDNDFDD